MRKLIIALAVLALLAVTVYAATPLCSSEEDCNTKQTIFGTPQYCHPTEKKCKDKAAKNKGDSVDKESFCKDLTKGDSNKCRPFGTKGCKAGDVVCAGDTNKDHKCDFAEDEKGQVAEGGRCKPDSSKGSEKCKEGEDLFCHETYKICVKKPAPYEPCLDGKCQVNAGCNFGMCVPIGSIGDGQFSASDTLCESGLAKNDRCKPTSVRGNYRQKCKSNSDCDGDDELCDMERGDKEGWGFCVGVQQHAVLELNVCKGQRCIGFEKNKTCEYDESKCLHAKVRLHCAQQCKEHESNRKALQGTKDVDVYAYAIDCASGSATPLEDNQCELKPQDVIKNCDAVFNNFRQSSASNLSSNVVALIAAAAAVVALVF